MVHKLYSERVQNFLLSSSESDPHHPPWVVVSMSSAALLAPSESPPRDDHGGCHGHRVTVLDTPLITGVSQARRGYVLLLINGGGRDGDDASDGKSPTGRRTNNISCCSTRFRSLPAMARQNISWVGRMTHSTIVPVHMGETEADRGHGEDTVCDAATTRSTNTTTSSIGSVIWNISSLRNLHRELRQKMLLRVDCHPRDRILDICRQLQDCAVLDDQQQQQHQTGIVPNSNNNQTNSTDDDDDPFEGPIAMTVSRSKCTHRLTVIILPQPSPSKRRAHTTSSSRTNETTDSSTTTRYYWGLEDRSMANDRTIMQLKLNHEAAEDVVVVPADSNGRDVVVSSSSPRSGERAGVSPATPLSRAYYKLHQVWHDYLAMDPCWEATIAQSNVVPFVQRRRRQGLDLGASPGGWTQVLVHCFGCTEVVAVDAGIVAQRALHPIVNKSSQANELSESPDPVVVCHVQSSMEQADLTRHEPYTVLVCDASSGWTALLDLIVSTVAKCTWACPAVVVVTLKMPFKTAGSIQRHVQDMHEKIPNFLRELQRAMFPQSSVAAKTNHRIRTRHQLVHLMANADSERTLIAILEQDS